MKNSTQVYIAVFWILFWTAQIMVNFDSYMRTDSGRLFLFLYGLALLLGVIFVIIIVMRTKWPKIMYKVNSSDRCPDCFEKVKKDTEFCPKCGRDLRAPIGPRVCWNCGYEEDDDSVTSCPKCGREFKKER